MYIIFVNQYIGHVDFFWNSTPTLGQDVLFTCTANFTNVIYVTVNGYRRVVFERNTPNPIVYFQSVLLNLTRRDIDPVNFYLSIFEVQGRVKKGRNFLNIKCQDATDIKTCSIMLPSESY